MNKRSALRTLPVLALFAVLVASSPTHISAELGHYDAHAAVTLDSVAPNAPRGETITLRNTPGDIHNDQSIIFEPSAVGITLGCNEIGYRDLNNDSIIDPGETPCLAPDDGAGTNTWDGLVGVVNGACDDALVLQHDLFSVATPNNELDPRASTNIAFPRPEGAVNRFGGWAIGAEPPALGGTAPDDADMNTRAEGTSLAIQNYPSFLLDLFDPDGPGAALPALPRAVYGGLTTMAGEWRPFYYVQFGAGALNTAFAGEMPHPFARVATVNGHPGIIVRDDPTTDAPLVVGDVNGWCSPASNTLALNATVGATNRATNPATAGTHFTLVYQASERDLDNDGYENLIDTCPGVANTENPRTTSGADGDAIDPACDPTPAVDTSAGDHDLDGWPNARDNCPLVANPTQADGEPFSPPDSFTAAFDGGPLNDDIGAACETGNTITPYAPAVTLTGAITSSQYTFTYTAAGDPITQGDYIIIDAEVMQVSDVTAGTNTLIVRRGAVGTTAAPHAAAAPIQRIVGITIILNGVTTPFVFSPTAATGHWHARGDVVPICYSTAPVDADGDGYCGAGTVGASSVDAADSGACNTPPVTPTPSRNSTCAVRHNSWSTTASMALLGSGDSDRGGGDFTNAADPGGVAEGITCPAGLSDFCPENAFDSDWFETYVGTDPTRACSANSGLNNEPVDNWLWDSNDDQRAGLSDIVAVGISRFVNQDHPAGSSLGFPSVVTLGGSGLTASYNDVAVTYVGADVISRGDYVSLQTGSATNYEILLVTDVNAGTNVLQVRRAHLGKTLPLAWAPGVEIRKSTGPRSDLNGDGTGSLSDITAFGIVYNKQCRRTDGTFGAPQ